MIYTLYGSADGSVAVDVREKDVIVAIDMDLDVVAANAGAAKAELSLGSASQFATNDATNVLAAVRNTTATAVGDNTKSKTLTGLSIPVNAGERLYLHQDKGGHTSAICRCIVYTRGATRPQTARR